LIRFVAGPDGFIIPDLAQNLPGRGLWVTADRDVLQTAAQKNLFSKAAKASVKVAPDLAAQVAQLMRKRCLELFGMSKRAGVSVLGQTQIEAALRSDQLALLLIADDASQELDSRHQVKESRVFTRNELGAAVGYDQIVYAGLNPGGLAEKLTAELARLEKIDTHSHIVKDSEQR
jgi:hypothetical protein